MRLIDADAFAEFLKDEVKRQKFEDIKIDGLTVADVIEAVISELEGTSLDGFKNAPTIEPERKKGKWVRGTNHGLGVYNYTCSECSHTIVTDDAYNYCPHCGCQNRGDEDE